MNLAKNATIVVSGEFDSISQASKVIASAKMSGLDICDRLVIQRIIEDNSLTAVITYNGFPIVSSCRIANNLSQMKKTGSLSDMSDETYQILGSLFDYPRVNKQTYIRSYNDSYRKLLRGVVINHRPDMPEINRIADILETDREALCG